MTDLPIAPVDRLIRKAGAKRVSEEAAIEMTKVLEETAIEIARKATLLAHHAGRKTIVTEDIQLALNAM